MLIQHLKYSTALNSSPEEITGVFYQSPILHLVQQQYAILEKNIFEASNE